MFTGLVQKIATVASSEKEEWGVRLVITCSEWAKPIEMGESICTAGCCLTVMEYLVENGENRISFDIVPESLRCTTLGNLTEGSRVNVERSLRSDSLLGGHFVQGHVDGLETILSVTPQGEEDSRLRISMNTVDKDTIVSKGSVTIDGVSLTIASVEEDWFEVALVPTTLQETTLGSVAEGATVNIETDILARTVVQVVRKMQQS